jgi:serine phosphatase RsbU (regulator of sigma subunit)
MPSLVLVKCPFQPPPFEEIELSATSQVIGRKPSQCQIVLDHDSVSKRHARVFADGLTFFVEDLHSHNKTFLNGRELAPGVARPLKQDDEIKICDFLLHFCAVDEQLTIVHAQDFLVAPADRLKAFLALSSGPPGSPDLGPLLNQVADTLFSTNLSRTLQLEPLLNQVADTLLGVFKHTERCFLLLHDDNGRPAPRVTKCRGDAKGARPSLKLIRKTVESVRSHLVVDTPGSTGAEPRSAMGVPLATSEGRAFGAIQVETRDRAVQFTPADLDLLTIVANFASVAIERVQLHAKAQAQAVVQSQLALARQVQLDFLPLEPPAVEGYEFFPHYSPAETVGGDFYDLVPLPGGRVAIVLGDVAGHGVPAALLVAKLSSEVRYCLLSEPDPAKAVSLLNDQMTCVLRDKFVTVVVMILDPVAHRLTVVNAGHTPPKLYSPARRVLSDLISVEASGVPLGVEAGYKYSSVTVSVNAEETITAYTDGVTDVMNPAGKTFGTRALEKLLAPRDADGPDAARPKRVGHTIVNAVIKHAEGRAQSDDIALVCFGRWDPSSESHSTLNGQASGTGSRRE